MRTKNKISENKKNIVKISGGTLAGQIVSFITVPILTRIYNPEILGIWAILNSIAILVKSFSDLGMTNSLMTMENEEKIEITYRVISTIVIFISLILASIFSLYYKFISPLNDMSLFFLFGFISVLMFTTQQIQLCYTWLNRIGAYDILMKNPLINGLMTGVFGIILGLLGCKKYGYFVGVIFGQIMTLINMKRHLPKKIITINLKDFKDVLIMNKRFVKFQLPTNIISNFKNQLPILLIKAFWGTEILGYYSITLRLLRLPISLLASSIGRVFFQTTSKMKREGKEIGNYVYQNLIKAMRIGVLPMFLLKAFGDIVIIIFLGQEWEISGKMIQILSIQYFFSFLMMTVQGLYIILNKQKYAMISSLLQAFAFLLGAVIGKYLFDDIFIALKIMVSLFVLINIIFFAILFNVMNIDWKKFVSRALFYIIIILFFSFTMRKIVYELGIINYILSFFIK